MISSTQKSFYQIITDAINDFIINGFDSEKRLEEWVERLRIAAVRELIPEHEMREKLRQALITIYDRLVGRATLLQKHPGISRFTLERVKPKLRAELDRRILASANLIKLNRQEAIERTLRRFSGWATSIPAGGSDTVSRSATKTDVRKAFASLPYVERRVAIDQGHKFQSNLSEILAQDGGAIAGLWRSNWRQLGYNYREDHKERDNLVYMVRGNWAQQKGLVKSIDGYTDDITKPGEEINCRCYCVWKYNLRDLPKEMLTKRGLEEIERVGVL